MFIFTSQIYRKQSVFVLNLFYVKPYNKRVLGVKFHISGRAEKKRYLNNLCPSLTLADVS